jgi:hypothetical protein
MPATVVRCSHPGCRELAAYKVAATWSDRRFSELKTYGHACAHHLGPVFRAADERRARYQLAPGESVGEICIYRYEKGLLDRQLRRLPELEEKNRSWGSGSEGV